MYVLINKTKKSFYRFANFLHVIAPSEEMFSYMMPMVYWHLDDQIIPENLNVKISRYFPRENYNDHELSYNIACSQIKYSVNGRIFSVLNTHNVHNMLCFFHTELVNLQIVFLKTLLDDDDQTETKVSSRILFSRQFQRFIQENIIAWRVNIYFVFIIYVIILKSFNTFLMVLMLLIFVHFSSKLKKKLNI